jgi:hypothetical protein
VKAREAIRAAAEAAGWRHTVNAARADAYRATGWERSGAQRMEMWELNVEFSARGALVYASARRGGDALISTEWSARTVGKAASVCAWLAEHSAIAPEPTGPPPVPLAPFTPAEIDALTEHITGRPPSRAGNGTTHTVRVERDGVPYYVTRVDFPTGRRRYTAQRFNGYAGGERFACAWDHLGFVEVPATATSKGDLHA